MTRLRKQETSIVSLAILFTLACISGVSGAATSKAASPKPLAGSLVASPIPAEATNTIAFPMPTNVPVGTSIRIGGSSSMETINQALKHRFEQQFVGTKVELNTQGTGPAIKDLLDGNADLAAIGRTLMEQEKAQGLMPVPVSRHKIAIIVGSENPFKGSLTFEQFAKIFRGEIKDWAQIGGEPGPIRFIDRPDNSDTRQAFRNYPVFKQAPFVTGKTATQLAQDSTSQVVQALRTDGIGYAIDDQLQGRGDVRVIPMHKTLPSNPKYPFSQPLIYVYKGPQPNLAAQAFLGYATAPVSRQTIETARKEATAAIANPDVASPKPNVTIPTSQAVAPGATTTPPAATPSPIPEAGADKTVPWLWLLAIPLVGGLLWWLLRNRDAESDWEEGTEEPLPTLTVDPGVIVEPPSPVELTSTAEPTPPVEPTAPVESIAAIGAIAAPLLGAIHPAGGSRLILLPNDCMNATAYWDIPTDAQAMLQRQGAQKLVLRLYDVTGIDVNYQPPESLQEFDCDAQAHDRTLPIRTDDRTYLGELGYIAADGRWLQVARSEPVHVPACLPTQTAIAPDIAAHVDEGVSQPIVSQPIVNQSVVDQQPSTPVDNAINGDSAMVPSDALLPHGTMMVDGSGTYTVMATDRSDLHASADDGQMLLAPRDRAALPADSIAPAGGTALVGGLGVAAATLRFGEVANGMVRDRSSDGNVSETLELEPSATAFSTSTLDKAVADDTLADYTLADHTLATNHSQIFLIPRTAHELYVYWDAKQAEKDALKQQGGQHLVLRVYPVTDDTPSPHSVQQYFCNDWDHDQHVPISVSNLDYVAELGYATLDGRFLLLSRSQQTRIPGA